MIIILGSTATGKTQLAANIANAINGEIISADSRQVFRGMDIGTGKDIADYYIDNKLIPYHLIDIAEPGVEYSVFNFQYDFYTAYDNIISRNKQPILCGGTGLYLESIIRSYPFVEVPVNNNLRKTLEIKSESELTKILSSFKILHNNTDTEDKNRLIRAIEIETYNANNKELIEASRRKIDCKIFGISFERNIIRERITKRLKQRLEEGMIDEVKALLNKGITHERLQRYGLEYKFVSLYLSEKISYETLFIELNQAIHQFSKRQMTWFRRMERNGIKINWIDGNLSLEEKVNQIIKS